MMDARGIDGLLNVHLEIDDVQDRLQNRRDNAASARSAENEDRLAVMAGRIHNFQFSEIEIFGREGPTTQIGLKPLNKFRFTRGRFGSEKARRPMRSSGESNRFCPSRLGKNGILAQPRRANQRRTALHRGERLAGMAGLAAGPTASRIDPKTGCSQPLVGTYPDPS
jgi:hypothetical protein